jgi:hypothetical protein
MISPIVPDVRAWSRWIGGADHGSLIITHHQYPDQSMCVCMPQQWHLGRPLIAYADMCVMWIGKALYERELGSYPGLQHYGEWVRTERDRADEYCGCGAAKLYRNCHHSADFALTSFERRRRHGAALQGYSRELRDQGRTEQAPEFFTQTS